MANSIFGQRKKPMVSNHLILITNIILTPGGGGGGYFQKHLVGVGGPLSKTLTLYLEPKSAIFITLFMT